jgi:hypothetical protein
MGPNDVDLTRVFTREPGTTVADSSIRVATGLEIVVEAEAGTALFGTGAQFFTNIVVRDITANNNIAATPGGGFGPAAMSSAAWPAVDHQFVYSVSAASLAGRQDHICEVLAFLKVGTINPDVEFATSTLFILTD